MLAFFAHVDPIQQRTTASNKTNRVAAGMRINAKKSFLHWLEEGSDLNRYRDSLLHNFVAGIGIVHNPHNAPRIAVF